MEDSIEVIIQDYGGVFPTSRPHPIVSACTGAVLTGLYGLWSVFTLPGFRKIPHHLKADLSSYNNVTAFLVPGVIDVLGEKLLKELPQDALVISCRFPFPNWPQKSAVGSGLDQTFAYEISSVRSHLRKTEIK